MSGFLAQKVPNRHEHCVYTPVFCAHLLRRADCDLQSAICYAARSKDQISARSCPQDVSVIAQQLAQRNLMPGNSDKLSVGIQAFNAVGQAIQ